MIFKGKVADAELCRAIEGVRIETEDGHLLAETNSEGEWSVTLPEVGSRVVFKCEGFAPKSYDAGQLPPLVRLLGNRTIGYCDHLAYFPGQRMDIKVHSITPYQAFLVRHGIELDRVLDLGMRSPKFQTIPDGHFVDCGLNWETAFSLDIPESARPGLYGIRLEPEDQSPCFEIPLIVPTPPQVRGKNAKLLVLASNTTWQSYNIWGGRSRYRNFETESEQAFKKLSIRSRCKKWVIRNFPKLAGLLQRLLRSLRGKPASIPNSDWKHFRLSIRRPFTNCALEEHDSPFLPFTNHLAAGEWRVLAWLEREGIEYDFVAGQHLHFEPELLANYDAILLSTHCEYWTCEMFQALKKAHERNGLSVLNFSGNSIYRQIEIFDDGSTRCLNLSFLDGCEDETSVLGVRYDLADYGSCAAYAVVQPDHFLFSQTNLQRGELFGRKSLNCHTEPKSADYNPGRPGSGQLNSPYGLHGQGASGWETDKLNLSRSRDFLVVAKGKNTGGGADMVYRERSGTCGAFFSASSITFGGALLIDADCSRIASNAIHAALANPKNGSRTS